MCGIAGIISVSAGRFNTQHVGKMTSCLTHRGPDGTAVWQNENATAILGHNRLAIIDLSPGGAQPMHYRNRYTIVHNGEIYNYKELREELSGKGYSFTTQSDTEIILASYDLWKEECLRRFDGMFAFAIWDEQERSLFAARDRFGEKPFYYVYDEPGNTLYFASEIKALYQYPLASKTVDGNMLLQYLSTGLSSTPDAQQTFHRDIRKLPQRHYLRLDTGASTLQLCPYYDIDKQQDSQITRGEAIERFRSLFFNSVQKRLRSDVEIGTSLSGGIDSASVVAAIHRLKEGHSVQKAFTASFPLFEKDETVFAKTVAQQFNLQHYLVSISANELASDLEKFLSHHDEPVSSASVYAQYKVYQLAKQNGIKVVLDGQGADEILSGYTKYTHWFLQELYSSGSKNLRNETNAFGYSFGSRNKLAARFPSLAAISLEKKLLKQQKCQPHLHPDFIAHNIDKEKVYKPVVRALNDILYFDVFGGNLEELLRNADRNAMAHGVEVRLPFLNHELVQFVFSLPAACKMHNGFTKYILRQTMNDMLPAEIAWRKGKIGFEPPQQQWMQDRQVQDKIHQAKKKLVQEKILDARVLDQPVIPKAAHEPGNYDWRYLSAAHIL